MEWSSSVFSKFVSVSDPRISRDGRKVAYTVSKVDLEKDEYETTIVVVDLKEGLKMYFKGSMPRFSKDSLFYIFEEDGKKLLKMADLKSGSSTSLARFDSIEDYSVSPSGRFILVRSRKRSEEEPAIFFHDVPIWFDGMGFLHQPKVIFKVLDSNSGEVLREFEEELFSEGIWHGDKIVVSSPRKEYGFWKVYDVYITDPIKGKKEHIFQEKSFRAVDSDGSRLLLIGKDRKMNVFEHNFLYVLENGEVKPAFEDQVYNVVSAKITRNGIFFTLDERGKITLKSIEKGYIRDIFSENAWVNSFDVSEDGEIVFIVEREYNPGEVYTSSGRITSYNDSMVDILKLARAEHFSFESLDLEIDGWYMRSEDDDSPIVVFVHGGPKGMYGYRFNFTMQNLVKSGFHVVYFNPRGSTGYDEDFALRVVKRTGKEDFQDIVNGTKFFLERILKRDEDRIGITGISYGGFMTNWALTQTKMFKAGLSENGISSWFNMYGVSDISLWFVKELIGDDPFSKIYEELSPITHVRNVETPLLLIHSMEDYRCPVDQSVLFYNALKDLEKEVYLVIFKRGAHGHSLRAKPKHREYRYELVKEFFTSKLIKGEKEFRWKGVKR